MAELSIEASDQMAACLAMRQWHEPREKVMDPMRQFSVRQSDSARRNVKCVDADVPNPEPSLADFASVRAFIKAYDAYHDGRRPTAADTLDRAVRLARDSMRGIDLQCRRVRSPEPEDDEWISRVCMDFQFLIVCLWRMRMAGRSRL